MIPALVAYLMAIVGPQFLGFRAATSMNWRDLSINLYHRTAVPAFFTLVSASYGEAVSSWLLTKGFGELGERLGHSGIAAAMLDRMPHHSAGLSVLGQNYRLTQQRTPELSRKLQSRSSSSVLMPSAEGNPSGDQWGRPIGGSKLDRRRWVKFGPPFTKAKDGLMI